MIEKPTVLVLGAGASNSVGYSTGDELIRQVLRTTYGAPHQQLGIDESQYQAFYRALNESVPSSIDRFLERRREFLTVGKQVIAYHLLRQENGDNLCDRDTWYAYLWRRLDAPLDEFGRNRLAVITFNYDLSLEEFLFRCVSHTFNRVRQQTIDLVNCIPIVHVYGHLGYLDWQANEKQIGRKYGWDTTTIAVENIKAAADKITIMYEAQDESEDLDRAKRMLDAADRIYFLGFGYHEENMRRLGFAEGGPFYSAGSKVIRGTSKDLKNAERRARMRKYPSVNLEGHDYDIYEFLRNDESFVTE